MKILHTGDLHLGRVFHERPLIEDQYHILEELLRILQEDRYDALLIAGDVYDRSIPSAEAVTLLGFFLARCREVSPHTRLCIISGNHDSAQRLAYGKELFQAMGIHIATTMEESQKPLIVEDAAGKRAAFFLLPFLYPTLEWAEEEAEPDHGTPPPPDSQRELSFLTSSEPMLLRRQKDRMQRIARHLEQQRSQCSREGVDHSILVAHLFARGGAESDSERLLVGTAEQVDPALFAGFDYLALGHLHRNQQVSPNGWYSGSPLAYSFDEADQTKVVLSVELEPGRSPLVTPIPLHPLRPLRRLSGPFASFLPGGPLEKEEGALRSSYLEIELTDEALVENPLSILRQRFPYLLSVKQDRALTQLSVHQLEVRRSQGRGEGKNLVEDFSLFLTELYQQADPARLELFNRLLLELEQQYQGGGAR
ncbi:MAG: exonuclease SbcCD subunit D [Treponemataceae bacterium]|nr:exonuclease SbcCD subunit D [Treponemataceae bacterium]